MLKDIIDKRVNEVSKEKKKKEDKLPQMKDTLEIEVKRNGEVIDKKENK
jgi:hypothetical protein